MPEAFGGGPSWTDHVGPACILGQAFYFLRFGTERRSSSRRGLIGNGCELTHRCRSGSTAVSATEGNPAPYRGQLLSSGGLGSRAGSIAMRQGRKKA